MPTESALKALRALREEIAKTTDPERLREFVIEVNELLTAIEDQLSRMKGRRR